MPYHIQMMNNTLDTNVATKQIIHDSMESAKKRKRAPVNTHTRIIQFQKNHFKADHQAKEIKTLYLGKNETQQLQ